MEKKETLFLYRAYKCCNYIQGSNPGVPCHMILSYFPATLSALEKLYSLPSLLWQLYGLLELCTTRAGVKHDRCVNFRV